MSKVEKVLELVKEMTVVELAELVKQFEEVFGVSAAAPVMAAPVAAAPVEAANLPKRKSRIDVILTGTGLQVQVIKTVRELTGLGLKSQRTG